VILRAQPGMYLERLGAQVRFHDLQSRRFAAP
jgi:hypothetical protein